MKYAFAFQGLMEHISDSTVFAVITFALWITNNPIIYLVLDS